MAEEKIPVQLILKDGSFANANFVLGGDNKNSQLSLEFGDRVITKAGHSFFHLLQEIRLEFEKDGILFNCYGASKNVRPSGMSISMGGGVMAYKHTLGKKSELKDLVEIWKTGPDVQPVTVAEQDAFFDKWLISVGIDKNRKVIPNSVKINRWTKWVLLGILILVVIIFLIMR
jgi:hypothetical protein